MTLNMLSSQNSDTPLILAHRGAFCTSRYPENTLDAFKTAVEQGADGFELDVRLSRDGEIVVFHDRSLQRLMGVEKPVSRLNYSGIRKLNFLSSPRDSETYVPTLKDIFREFGSTVVYNIEVKSSSLFNGEMIDRLGNLIREYKLTERVWVSCFNPVFLYFWNKKFPAISTGYLFESWNWVTRWFSRLRFVQALHPSVSLLNDYHQIRSLGKPICYWTVNSEQELKSLRHMQVAGIITDDLPLTRRIILNA